MPSHATSSHAVSGHSSGHGVGSQGPSTHGATTSTSGRQHGGSGPGPQAAGNHDATSSGHGGGRLDEEYGSGYDHGYGGGHVIGAQGSDGTPDTGINNGAGGGHGAAHGKRTHWIYFFDGTSKNANNPAQKGRDTNVKRLQRCIAKTSRDGTIQKTEYMRGIGSDDVGSGPVVPKLTGAGINDNIKTAYRWFSANVQHGDVLSVFGFSRGGFTARCVVDFVTRVGLWKGPPEGPHQGTSKDPIDTLYEIWAESKAPRTVIKLPENLSQHIMGLPNFEAEVCGVWDSVASIGTPDLWGLRPALIPKILTFMEEPPVRLKVALQALSLLDYRENFEARVWERKSLPEQILKQVWFYGFHSDVGGGTSVTNSNLPNLTLAWMASEITQTSRLAIDHANLERELALQPVSTEDGGAKIKDSKKSFPGNVGSSTFRRPGAIRADESKTIVADTQHRSAQSIHMSVRLLKILTGVQVPHDTILSELFASHPALESGDIKSWPAVTTEKYIGKKPQGTQISEATPSAMEKALWDKIRRHAGAPADSSRGAAADSSHGADDHSHGVADSSHGAADSSHGVGRVALAAAPSFAAASAPELNEEDEEGDGGDEHGYDDVGNDDAEDQGQFHATENDDADFQDQGTTEHDLADHDDFGDGHDDQHHYYDEMGQFHDPNGLGDDGTGQYHHDPSNPDGFGYDEHAQDHNEGDPNGLGHYHTEPYHDPNDPNGHGQDVAYDHYEEDGHGHGQHVGSWNHEQDDGTGTQHQWSGYDHGQGSGAYGVR